MPGRGLYSVDDAGVHLRKEMGAPAQSWCPFNTFACWAGFVGVVVSRRGSG